MAQNNKGQCTKQYHSQMGLAATLKTEKGNSEKNGVKNHASNSCENHGLLLENLFNILKTDISLLKEES